MAPERLDLGTPATAGDPMGKRQWVRRRRRKLSQGLAPAG